MVNTVRSGTKSGITGAKRYCKRLPVISVASRFHETASGWFEFLELAQG